MRYIKLYEDFDGDKGADLSQNKKQIYAVYDVKIGRKWSKVRASGTQALSKWAKENNVTDWRMVGMRSRQEMLDDESLPIVA